MATTQADVGLPGLSPVTVDCGDGYPLHANVSAAELAKLQGVMQAMLADATSAPACTLTQDAQPEQNETHPFVFGSGTYGSIVNCELRFHVKGSLDANGDAHGFQRVEAPPDNCGVGPGGGELRASVTCISVAGNIGEIRGIVTESTGPLFSTYLGIHPGDVLFTQAQENQPPVPDQIFQDKGAPDSQNACVAEIDNTQKFPLDSGDIEVRQ